MKKFILGFIVAISLPVMAAVLWPSGAYLETFQNGFIFGTGKVLSVLNNVITFDDKRLDDAPKDRVHFQDFEGASVSFTCGTNLTKADDASTPLNETKSVTFTQGATPPTVGIKCAGPTISLPLKAQSKNLVEVCFQATWDGNDNEMALNIDSGGTDLVQVLITASTTAKKHCGYFSTSSTTSVDLDIEVIAQNANAVLEIDDLEITIDPLTPTDIFASSKSEDAGLVAGDFINTTATSIVSRKHREGRYLVYNVAAATASGVASEFRVNLPSGLTIETSFSPEIVGEWTGSTSPTEDPGKVLATNGNSYLTFAIDKQAADGLSGIGGNQLNSAQFQFKARVPIAGWSNTSQGVVVKNRTDSASVENGFSARIANNGTATITSQSVDFIESVSRTGLGIVLVTFKSGFFSVAPSVVANIESANVAVTFMNTVSLNTNSVEIRSSDNGGTFEDKNFNIKVTRQGTDYIKETDKVYTVPVTNLVENVFSATVDANIGTTSGDIVSENVSGWLGAIPYAAGEYTVNFQAGLFSVAPSCTATSRDTVGSRDLRIYGETTTSIKLATHGSGGSSQYGFSIKCQRQGSDYIAPKGVYLGTFGQPTCFVKDVKANGSDGGTATAGVNTRVLNTVEGDCSFLSLSSNQFTLDSGAYHISCEAPVYAVDEHRADIYNVTDTSYDILGMNMQSAAAGYAMNRSLVKGKLSIASSKTYELRHYVAATRATSGFGLSVPDTNNEIYSICEITKVR